MNSPYPMEKAEASSVPSVTQTVWRGDISAPAQPETTANMSGRLLVISGKGGGRASETEQQRSVVENVVAQKAEYQTRDARPNHKRCDLDQVLLVKVSKEARAATLAALVGVQIQAASGRGAGRLLAHGGPKGVEVHQHGPICRNLDGHLLHLERGAVPGGDGHVQDAAGAESVEQGEQPAEKEGAVAVNHVAVQRVANVAASDEADGVAQQVEKRNAASALEVQRANAALGSPRLDVAVERDGHALGRREDNLLQERRGGLRDILVVVFRLAEGVEALGGLREHAVPALVGCVGGRHSLERLAINSKMHAEPQLRTGPSSRQRQSAGSWARASPEATRAHTDARII
ncbi:hydrolase [Babesia caballi]|uniref:Hydrolase n=1 Tax=Babesia caballi TaxID=5871 RepID=A0AAV4LYG8_BABCB|nr:hydrolase [Babesia caballi]